MARLASEFAFTGSLGNLSAYRMKGSDKIILRRKGGGSKKTIKTSRSCANIRRNNMEFGGRSTASRLIREAIVPLRLLADFNFTGHLNKLLKPVQEFDPVNEKGQRSIHLSKYPKLLEGFSLNEHWMFDSAVRTPVAHVLDKETCTATVTIPALIPDINFHPLRYHPLYSFILTLGVVPDLNYARKWKTYKTGSAYKGSGLVWEQTEWLAVGARADVRTLELKLAEIPAAHDFTLVLGIGLCYGTVGVGQQMQEVAHAGSAKILATV